MPNSDLTIALSFLPNLDYLTIDSLLITARFFDALTLHFHDDGRLASGQNSWVPEPHELDQDYEGPRAMIRISKSNPWSPIYDDQLTDGGFESDDEPSCPPVRESEPEEVSEVDSQGSEPYTDEGSEPHIDPGEKHDPEGAYYLALANMIESRWRIPPHARVDDVVDAPPITRLRKLCAPRKDFTVLWMISEEHFQRVVDCQREGFELDFRRNDGYSKQE
ncbi:hypothetical protein EW146_g209 [Bondarzewia mesenterica]|uniref:Uncharacterized protein n=1 Tax=Bondarzewia mesenterica TaxID=1095465 RepID=A0A4S4M8A2_9AGAM|nr:hypothetical protein EW146_g209 [Bondarzewia mesenterica]